MEKPGREITIHFHKDFQKRVLKYSHRKDAINKAVKIFQTDFTDSRLKTHKLTGLLLGKWAFSVDYHLRIMFYFVDDKTIVFLDIGTHEIYK